MIEMKDLNRIAPKDLEIEFGNRTSLVSTVKEPRVEAVVGVSSLEVNEDGTSVAVLTKLQAVEGLPDELVVDAQMFAYGGVIGGFQFSGVRDVIDLIHPSVEQDDRSPQLTVPDNYPIRAFPLKVFSKGPKVKAIL